ncbi:MAG: ribosomal L7Ae/L30e/S12e/Gadd45 family protein [Bacillota bacterium]|nr:ribosomal L7Ae/L30e/S12e/Gadd45 family protein [Bacillota bacterium]
MLSELNIAEKAIGIKQSKKKIRSGEAKKVFLAKDAAPNLISGIVDDCEKSGIDVEWVSTMKELGNACEIDVGAAIAVVY